MSENAPVGKRYSQVYLDRAEPQRDSERFRVRLLSSLDAAGLLLDDDFLKFFRSETGSYGPVQSYASKWKPYILTDAQLRDLLDIPTVVMAYLGRQRQEFRSDAFIVSIRRILLEESMGYQVDQKGGIHPFVDPEFERSRTASIASLGLPRYGAALAHFEASYAALDGVLPDTRTAIRETFDALETIVKLMLPVSRLGAAEVKKELSAKALHGLDGAENHATSRMLASLAEWTNAAHQYRHAQGTEQPALPSMDFAVLMMGTGATFLRWLITLDSKANSSI